MFKVIWGAFIALQALQTQLILKAKILRLTPIELIPWISSPFTITLTRENWGFLGKVRVSATPPMINLSLNLKINEIGENGFRRWLKDSGWTKGQLYTHVAAKKVPKTRCWSWLFKNASKMRTKNRKWLGLGQRRQILKKFVNNSKNERVRGRQTF